MKEAKEAAVLGEIMQKDFLHLGTVDSRFTVHSL